MDLPLTAAWLVPLGAGVVILAALIVLVLSLRRNRKPPARPTAEGWPAPQRARPEWPAFGPAPMGAGGQQPQGPAQANSFASVPAHWSGASRPAGVAAITPEQPAGTAPPAPPAVEQAPGGAPQPAVAMAPAPDGPPSGPVPVAPWARVAAQDTAVATDPQPGGSHGDGERPVREHTGSSRTVAAAVAQAFALRAAAGKPSGSEQSAGARVSLPEPQQSRPVPPSPQPAPEPSERQRAEPQPAQPEPAQPEPAQPLVAHTGSAEPQLARPHPVEAQPAPAQTQPSHAQVQEIRPEPPAEAPAVSSQAHAPQVQLGERQQPVEPPHEQERPPVQQAQAQPGSVQQGSARQAPAQQPAPTADARDRLLAVLLHDPALAVDATIQLDACRAQLDRLSHAMRHERGVLRDILQRLTRTGLRPDQLARLAGMPVEELQALLAPVPSR